MSDVEAVNRTGVSVALNYPEVSGLLSHWNLQPNLFSPLRELAQEQEVGDQRSIDDILAEARDLYEDAKISDQIKVVAQADRLVEARLASFGAVSDVTRFYWSDAAKTPDWTAIRSHDSFDCGLLFPYSTSEILRWVSLQTSSSGGVSIAVPSLDLSFRELNVLAGLLDAWKVDFAHSFVRRSAVEPADSPIKVEGVVRSLKAGLEAHDRRFFTTCLQELLKLMVRPDETPSLSLEALSFEDVESCLEGFELWGLLSPCRRSGEFLPTSAFINLASSFFSWNSVFSFHDVQVVEGGSDSYRAEEEAFLLWSTPLTLWALSTDGLTGSREDSEGLTFQLTSCDQTSTFEALEVFLHPVERAMDHAFYERSEST